MKRLVLALSSLTLIACGGGSTQVRSSGGDAASGFQVKGPTEGSTVDRLMAMQESFFAIIGNAQSSDEAAAGIDAYCSANADAIAKTLAEQEANLENEAMRDEFVQRSAKLMERADKSFGERPDLMEDGKIQEAMDRCKPQG